jgi:hypothetical protein
MTTLRPYQSQAVEWAQAQLQTHDKVLVQMPTGAGKTVVIQALGCGGIIAPNTDLVEQLRARTGAQVYTAQYLSRKVQRGEPLPELDLWAIDEARWVSSPKYGQILSRIGKAVLFDATPATPQGEGLGQWASALYQGPSVRSLINDGYLVPYRVLSPDSVCRDLAQHPVRAYLDCTPGESAICFAQDKAHARELCGQFTGEGVPAAVLTDDTPDRERAQVIHKLGEGSILVAVCAQILRQGIDVPRVSSIILARAVGSHSLYLQAVGRGARPWESKERCTVLDLRGARHIHGLPDDPVIWSLDGPAARPPGEPLPPCVRCKKCLSWGRSRVCELCGEDMPPPPRPKVRVQDLVEYRQSESEDRKRAVFQRYVFAALDKGHNPWSAVHKFKAVYGSEPVRAWLNQAIIEHKRSMSHV